MSLSATFDRLARALYRRRLVVVVVWSLLAALGAWSASGVKDVLYGSTVELAGTPSHQVSEALRRDFKNPFAEIAVVTMHSDRWTVDDPAYAQAMAGFAQGLAASPTVKKVLGFGDAHDARLRSADGHTTMLLVGLDVKGVQEAERATPGLRAAIAPAGAAAQAADPSFRWATTGRGALSYDVGRYGAQDSTAAEGRVIPLTLLILVLAFGALVAAGVPLAMGLLATTLTLGLVAVLGRAMPLGAMVQNVCTMVGLAVGIDYSLLMISRFRESLARGLSTEDALAETMRTAGVAVACSGVTVMIGLAGLGLTPSLDTRSIGLGGALVLVVGVTLALTLLPAILGLLGPRIDAPRSLARVLKPVDAGGLWRRWAAWVMGRPRRLAALGLILLLAMMAPLASLRTEFATSRWIPSHELEFHTGFDMLETMGKKNASTPIVVLVTSTRGPILSAGLPGLVALSEHLHADPRVLSVLGPVDPDQPLNLAAARRLYRAWPLQRALAPSRFEAWLSRDGQSCLVQVVARDSQAFEDIRRLARDLRAMTPPDGLTLQVGGQAAYYNDVNEALNRSLPGMVAFVLGATFILLALAYRSWLVPLKATLLNLLSVGAGFGALVVVFQWGWGASVLGLPGPTGGIPTSVLTLIFCVVFGMSMDYEVFLLSRIKEGYDATFDNARATEEGLAATGGMITAAALIMVCVFGAFAFAKMVMVQMLGVGLGVAVLVDATLVRVLLAPSLMRLAGDWNWHPGVRTRRVARAADPAADASSAPVGGEPLPSHRRP